MISIIIPTLQEEKYLEALLVSLKKSLTLPYEIIVTDGGSTDGTVSIAKKYADSVVLYPKDIPQTIGSNRNFGAKHAQGDYLLFLDGDSRLDNPDFILQSVRTLFEQDKALGGVTLKLKVYPDQAIIVDRIIFTVINFNFTIMNHYLGLGGSFGKFQFVRRDVFNTIGGYREDFAVSEDMNLFSRIIRAGQKTRVDRRFYVYHSARRARKLGWPKLLFLWNMNGIFIMMRHRPMSKEWKPLR